MAVLTPLSHETARQIAAHYDIGDLRRSTGIAAGSVNSNFELDIGGRRYFLRLYEEQDVAGAEREAAMLERLSRGGVPTPAPVRRTDGRLISTVLGKAAALFPWRDGIMRCQASVTPADARLVGAALARVHRIGANEPCGGGRFRYQDLCARLDVVAASGDAAFVALVPGLRAALDAAHAARDGSLPGGLTHGDLFRDNVLWDGSELSALLDFESACAGTYAYDFMVTVLAWCVGGDLDIELARAMLEGYESVRPFVAAERAALAAEGCFASLRFTITRITDYALRTDVVGPRVVKDWRRFMMRFDKLKAFGSEGLLRRLLPASL